MGENKHIKELDAFTKKYIKDIYQEKPSLDFTNAIMDKIALESSSDVFKVKALITNKGWFVISLLVAAVIIIPLNTSESSVLNLPNLDFSFFDKLVITGLFESVSISNTVFYAIFFFGLMFMAQVFFIKNYFDKKLNQAI